MVDQLADDIKKNLGNRLAVTSDVMAQVLPYAVPGDDVTDLPWTCRGIRATGAGNVKITDGSGAAVVIAFAAGQTRHVIATRIHNTGTTATGLEIMR